MMILKAEQNVMFNNR